MGLSTNDPKVLLDFLQSVPVEKLVNKNPFVLGVESIINNIIKFYQFAPVVEKDFGAEHFLTERPEVLLKNKKVNDVDVIVGYTNQESLISVSTIENMLPLLEHYMEAFVPRKILMKVPPFKAIELGARIRKHTVGNRPVSTDTYKEIVKLMNEAMIYDCQCYLRLLPANGRKRYFYQFSCISERNIFSAESIKYGISGAAHLEDMMYLCDVKSAKLPIDKHSNSYKLIMQFCRLFTNFAKLGYDYFTTLILISSKI